MDKAKKYKAINVSPLIETRDLHYMGESTGNLYKAVVAIAKRSNQISAELKEELHSKLEEFASNNDNLEEIHENREQIEISKAYEKLPHPTILATNEFMNGELFIRMQEEEPIKPAEE